ncbi:MAG TPA: transglutaminase family protein [Pirellulaceae bacterium]|nr:transglutaminase family protein [Pirellulaceae bacterium]
MNTASPVAPASPPPAPPVREMVPANNMPVEAKAVAPSVRRLKVLHATTYTYDRPVERSIHRLHLRPITDAKQRVVTYDLKLNPSAPLIEYEDVFGNATSRFEVVAPYTEFQVSAESLVDIVDDDPFAFANLPIRPSFPVSWMPWELTMLTPYLTSAELPETQIRELFYYAMSFVERNNRDLMETLFAINLTLFREYKYVPGSTVLQTTPYDVYTQQQGVCQDFSNLFICLARLLGIPARYVCGYVFCPQLDSLQSAASHAWVELYIPQVGWKGFDPTNGILPRLDHVRVAVGRHYRDTAPTDGTIFSPAVEAMNVHVSVQEVAPLGVVTE